MFQSAVWLFRKCITYGNIYYIYKNLTQKFEKFLMQPVNRNLWVWRTEKKGHILFDIFFIFWLFSCFIAFMHWQTLLSKAAYIVLYYTFVTLDEKNSVK